MARRRGAAERPSPASSWRPLAAAPLLLLALLPLLASGAPKKRRSSEDDATKKVFMPHHSFANPLEYSGLLEDWTVSGASLFERERLLVHPGVLATSGFAFNKLATMTNDFEIIMHFRVQGEKEGQNTPPDQAFALWYVAENISSVYNEKTNIEATNWVAGLEKQGMNFVGSKASFDGFGAVLSVGGAGKKASVAFVSNDGSRALSTGQDLPLAQSTNIDFRNTLNPAQLKLRVTPNKIEGFLKQTPSFAWKDCFSVERPVKAGGFIGITAFSGSAAGGVQADLVSVMEIEVNNYDENSLGEEMKDVSAQIQEAYRQMLTDESRHFMDQKSQTEHLQRLLDMLTDHYGSAKPQDDKLLQDVQALTARVDNLSNDCANLQKEAHVLLGQKGKDTNQQQNIASMKQELVGLRRALVKDTATHRRKIEEVHKNIAEVRTQQSKGSGEAFTALLEQTDTLEKTIASRGSQMSWMMLLMLVSVAGVGYLMYNRMHYYEKKHFI